MSQSQTENPAPPPPAGPVLKDRRPVNYRSLLLGLAGVTFICGLTPYNDYVVNNTFLVGNFLPIGLLLFFIAFVLLINGPLWRFKPTWAFTQAELAVALGMTLVSCVMPSSGLMRYLPAHLIIPYYHAAQNADYRLLLEEVNLPDWLLPTFSEEGVLARGIDPVVRDFWNRTALDRRDFWSMVGAVPWSAWVTPAITWGIFFAFLFGAVIFGSVIIRKQWVENERLNFPLASIYTSLIETPSPGRAFNTLFRSYGFWLAFTVVFILHAFNGLNAYFPRVWPAIPLSYDFGTIFADPPWVFTDWSFKSARLYFCVIGITFFLQTKIAFSLWFFYIVLQATRMILGTQQAELTGGMQTDQIFGGVAVFSIAVLWVGRHHWLVVFKQMNPWRRIPPNESQGRYMPYWMAGWGFVLCLAGVIVWLTLAGMSLVAAFVCVTMMFMLFLVIARVVAETGMIFAQIPLPLFQPWLYAPITETGELAFRTTVRSYYLSALVGTLQTRDLREALPVYQTHALKIADDNAYGHEKRWTRAFPLIPALALALLVGYLVAGASTLWCNYNYATTMDRTQQAPLNPWGLDGSVRNWTMDPPRAYMPPGTGSRDIHNRYGHFTFGAVLTATLSFLRLRFMNWPLHPVGFLMVFTYPMMRIWFSIMIGWLAKVLIVRFGGIDLFRAARTVFIGMIIGETGAAAFWLIISLILSAFGLEYRAIILMPT